MKTVQVDIDRDTWLQVPETWPFEELEDVDAWSAHLAGLIADHLDWAEEERDWFRQALYSVAVSRDQDEHRFVYLANPLQALTFASVLQGPSNDDLTMEQLAGLNDPDVTGPPDVEPFESPHLGRGLRTVRYVDAGEPDHDIAAVTQYAWRTDGLDIAVVVGDFDLVAMAALVDAFDEFARSISVVDA